MNAQNKNGYVQYGCGLTAPIEWRNFDASPTLRFQRLPVISRTGIKPGVDFPDSVEYGNIVKGLPVLPNSCDAVYCSHVLEHLSYQDCARALKNTLSILKPGAVFRLVVPDLEHNARCYLDDDSDQAANTFMKETLLGYEEYPRNLKSFFKHWLGNQQHLWMWDYKSMADQLLAVGFDEIRRAQFGDSTEPAFSLVESHERWTNCLGIECVKL